MRTNTSATATTAANNENEEPVLLHTSLRTNALGQERSGESEHQFHSMMDALPAAIYTTDALGRITYFNPACVEFSGRVPELGSDHWCVTWKLYYPDGRPMPHDECPMAIALKEGRMVRGAEAIAERPDGTRIWFEPYPTPFIDDAGNITGGINMLVDITERKQAEEATARLAAIVTSSDDAIIGKDLDGIIRSWNSGAERLFGYAGAEIIGKPVTTLIPPDHLDDEPVILARLRRGERIEHYETVRRRKDGSLVDISLTVSPVRNSAGQIIGAAKIARDITERKRTEEALRAGEERYRQTLSLMPAAVYCCDSSGLITYYNKQAARLWGRAPMPGDRHERFCGSEEMILPDGTRLRHEECPMAIALREGRSFRGQEVNIRRPDGSLVSVLVNIDPICDSQGRVVGAINAFHDVTAIKQAEQAVRESEERFRMLADNMDQLAWTCDKLGNVTWYNKRWLEYTGRSFEDMRDWGWTKCHHPDHVDRVVASVTHCRETGEVWEDTFPLRGRDGRYRWFLSRAIPIRDAEGNILRWFGTNTDVTEQLAAEDSLREADRRKNEFLAMLAHELRNPLAPIRNAVQILRLAGGNETIQSVFDTMERQVNQLIRMVDDLLDVNRISQGKIELCTSRVELASIVEHAVEAVRPICQNKGHDLSVTMPRNPVYLDADSTRLAQVLSNLLNNACKFTHNGGRITLTAEQQGEFVLIRVRDDGIGIAADQLSRIFDLFTQVDTSLERSASGLGIGLTLVKNLVEMHNGTVEARSDGIGRGSEFIVRLPISVTTAKPQTRVPAASKPSTTVPRRILVVDDNRDSAKTLAMLLKLTGHETHVAHDGLEAVAAAEKFQPDVVLLDIGLPRLNGYDTAVAIRQQPWGKGMLLVALTGWGHDDDRQKSSDAGFDAHFVKPVDHAALSKLLAESLPQTA